MTVEDSGLTHFLTDSFIEKGKKLFEESWLVRVGANLLFYMLFVPVEIEQ
jgi:hypothetical protein